MVRFPFGPQVLDSGEVGGGDGGVFVEDAFALERGGGRLSLAEMERRQVEAERVWRERGERFERAVSGAWANVRPVAQPVLEGLQRSSAAVAAPLVALREMQRAPRNAAGGIDDWSEVGRVFRDVMVEPGNVSLERVVPGVVGQVLDVLAPGPVDAVPLGRLAGGALDGLSALLSRWEGVAPGLGAFLLPLRESFAKGSSSEQLVRVVDDAVDRYLDPTDAARFRSELRDLVFRQTETKSTGLYPDDFGSYGDAAEDRIQQRLTPEVFDYTVPGMRKFTLDLEDMSPVNNRLNKLWRSSPEIAEDFEAYHSLHNVGGWSQGFLDSVVRAISDYQLPDIYGWRRTNANIQGTAATRNFDADIQVPDSRARSALSRYTGESNVDDITFTQGTEKNIRNLFDGNLYNALNTFLRSLDSVRMNTGASRSNLSYEQFYDMELADAPSAMQFISTAMGPNNPISWIEDPSDLARITEEISNLDRAFQSASLPSDTVVYRGAFADPNHPIGINITELMEQSRADPNFNWQQAADALKGRVMVDRGFSSFTERPQHAYSFIRPKSYAARTDTGQDRVGILYQMRLPQGSPTIPLYGHANNDDANKIGSFAIEQEILLPRGVPMRIVDAKFRFPLDVDQGSMLKQGARHHLDAARQVKPYLVVLVEPDFSQVR